MTAAKRPPGRQAADGAIGVERVTIALTPADRDKLRQLGGQAGGSAWIRSQIRAAPPVAGGAPIVRKP